MRATWWRQGDRRGWRVGGPGKVRVVTLVAIGVVALVFFAPLLLSYLSGPGAGGGVGAGSNTPFARSIRFVGVQPDLSDDILDAEGRKVGTLFADGGNHGSSMWDQNSLRRHFLFELPDDDEPMLLVQTDRAVTPAGVPYSWLGGSSSQFEIRHEGKRLLVLPHTFSDRHYGGRVLWSGRTPVERVDVTLRFFRGPPGEALFTAEGPFTPQTVINTKGGLNGTLTFQHDTSRGEPGARIGLTTPLYVDSNTPITVFDKSGRRYLTQRHGYSGGSRGGAQFDCYVPGLPPEQIARVAVGERPQVRVFRNILVRYRDRPNPGHAPYLDEMSRILHRPAQQIAQGSLKSTDEAVQVMHVVRANDVRNVASRLDSVKFDQLDAATQERLRATAREWARQPYPQVRLAGIQLGLRWVGAEFVPAALDLLQEADQSVTGSLANALRNCKTLTAEDVGRITDRVLASDDRRTCWELTQMLCTRDVPGAAEARWALARADFNRPWLWWPAIQSLPRDRGQIPDRTALDETLRLKLILAAGPAPGEQALAPKAYARLPELLTPQVHWMDSNVAHSIYTGMLQHSDVPAATAAIVRCLRGMDGAPRNVDYARARLVKRINLWYLMDFGRLGWDVRSESHDPYRQDWAGTVEEVGRWYDNGGGRTLPPAADSGRTFDAHYGPIRELTIRTSGPEPLTFVDLDDGTMHAGPASRNWKTIRNWCRANGMEARAQGQGLQPHAMETALVPDAFWPAPDPRVPPYALSRIARGSEVSAAIVDGRPTTFAFRTSQGQVGLLRIEEFSAGPPSALRIRYRFLTTPADPPAARCQATVTPVAGTWQINAAGGAWLVYGWAVLEGGVVADVTGGSTVALTPGTGNLVQSAGAMRGSPTPGLAVLSFSATPNGSILSLHMKVNSANGSSGTGSSTQVPPGTTLKTTSLSQAAELTDADNLTLWRGDFVDTDGRAVRSVIFAARLVADDDPQKWFCWPYAPPPEMPPAAPADGADPVTPAGQADRTRRGSSG